MRTSDNMKGTLADIASLVKDEFKTISTSYAILLVLVGGIFLYGLLYNYMYAPDLVRNAPVVVVDDSKTDLSREYIRLLNATPQVSVIADGLDYAEAQEWMKEGDAVGILYLPSDFETRVARGNESLFIMYQTTSAFLYYMAMQEASSGAMLALNDRYRPEMLVFLPQQDASKIVSAQPISVVGTAFYGRIWNLFDPGGIDRHYVPDLVDGDRYDKRGRAGFGYHRSFRLRGIILWPDR